MQNSKRRKVGSKLDGVLKRIYAAEVALEPNHHLKNDMVMAFLNYFEVFAKQRSVEFRELFHGFYHTGSYFEGLRVKLATEFDINVQLSLGLDSVDYLVNELDRLPSYATYKLTSSSYAEFTHSKTRSLFDSEGYLIGQNVLKWFQSLVDSFVNNTEPDFYPGVVTMRTTNSGPARTVKVLLNTEWISIDLVPVFSLSADHLYKYSFPCAINDLNAFSSCFLVPKPLHSNLIPVLEPKMVDRVWRINFTRAEKDILDSKPELKPAIQLLKALRDKENWSLPSYFLKVVGLHLIVSKLRNKESTDKLDHIFLELLESLKTRLDRGCLSHLFYRCFNLFHTLKSRTLQDVGRRVQCIIEMLRKRPDQAYQLFQVVDFSSTKNIPVEMAADCYSLQYHMLSDGVSCSLGVDATRAIQKRTSSFTKVKYSNKNNRKTKQKPKRGPHWRNAYLFSNHQNDLEMDFDSRFQQESVPGKNNMPLMGVLPRYMGIKKGTGSNKFQKVNIAYPSYDVSPSEYIPIDSKVKEDVLPRNIFDSSVDATSNWSTSVGKAEKYSRKNDRKIKKMPRRGFQLENTYFSPNRQNYPEMDVDCLYLMQRESLPMNDRISKRPVMAVSPTNMRNRNKFLKFSNAYPLYGVSATKSIPSDLQSKDDYTSPRNIFHSTSEEKVKNYFHEDEQTVEARPVQSFQPKNAFSSPKYQDDPEMDDDAENRIPPAEISANNREKPKSASKKILKFTKMVASQILSFFF